MKRLSVFLSIVWVIALQGSIAVTTASSHYSNNLPKTQTIHLGLEKILDQLPPGEQTTVIVSLRNELDLAAYAAVSTHSRQARRAQLTSRLREFASASQKDLLSQVQEWERQGAVSRVVPFWIINAFSLTASAEVIRALAERPEVAAITPEITVHAPEEPFGPAV
ncbi:MAG TPA: hypothetical protein VHO48_08070, partial [Anaerolineaceae bacterium]|nr:hypothetical protein [Anaerolineaceae bacterium]